MDINTRLEDAMDAALDERTEDVDTTDEELLAEHREMVVLIGEVGLWAKSMLAEVNKATAEGDFDKLDSLKKRIRRVTNMLDKKADQSTRTGRHSDKKPGRTKRAYTWLSTPRS